MSQPIFSPDGRYWWDGTRWVPVQQPQPPPVPPQPVYAGGPVGQPYAPATPVARRSSRAGCIVGLIVALVVLSLVVGGAVLVASRLQHAANQAGFGGQTVNQRIQTVRYVAVVFQDLPPIASAQTQTQADSCGTDPAACKAALRASIAAIDKMDKDLGAVQVPSCLATTDKDLRQSLRLIRQGDTTAIDAINSNDTAKLNQATALIDQGGAALRTAGGDVTSAQTKC